MKVFITGVNGFIGSHLAVFLKSKGLTVFGGSLEHAARCDLTPVLSGYNRLLLNREFDAGVFKKIDVLVHCAYSFDRRKIKATNIEGTKKWFYAARDMGVERQVFMTSYSAKPAAKSDYGFIKYELECFFLGEEQAIVRPGLVLGNGGLFYKMGRILKNYPFIPLLDGGNYEVPVISVETLCRAIEKILPGKGAAQYHIFQEEMVSMKHLLREMKRQLGAKCLFLPIPAVFPLVFLKTMEMLHIPFPIKSGSIVALKENQALSLTSSLAQLGIQDKPLTEILKTIGGTGHK